MRRRLALGACAALLAAVGTPVLPGAGTASSYPFAIGTKVIALPDPPVVTKGGIRFISFAVVEALHPGPAPAPAKTPPPQSPLGGKGDPKRDPGSRGALLGPLLGLAVSPAYASNDSSDVQLHGERTEPEDSPPEQPEEAVQPPPQILSAPAGSASAARQGRGRHKLGAHTLDLALPGQPIAAEVNGQPVAAADLLAWGSQRYIAEDVLASVGLILSFDSANGCYGLCGLIYRVEYQPRQSLIALHSLTPVMLSTEQVDENNAKVQVEGGFFANPKGSDFTGDPRLTKMSFKSQPQLGRSFMYLRQPKRTGLHAVEDKSYGYAQLRLGNYFHVASYDLTSSGEISLNVELGAPAEVRPQLMDSPPRLVLDFAGVGYLDATQRIPVGKGAAKEIRIGKPQDGTLRVVVELAQQRDYRILSGDKGARYYVQLLPVAGSQSRFTAGRSGRTVMLDAGHGGSDQGAPGVVPGVIEKTLALQITKQIKAELEAKGYKVLLTRGDDRFVSLGQRTDYANAALPYVFVSIHCNSISDPAMTGAMTFHHDFASAQARTLAASVQAGLLAATGATDKGVRAEDFFVLRETVMPAVLVECGFLTNKEECGNLCGRPYQTLVAKGIANGIDAFVSGR